MYMVSSTEPVHEVGEPEILDGSDYRSFWRDSEFAYIVNPLDNLAPFEISVLLMVDTNFEILGVLYWT